MRQFFITQIEPFMVIEGSEAKHMTRVLRLKVGDEVEVVDQAGQAAVGRIAAIEGEKVSIEFAAWLDHSSEPPIQVILAQALTKNDKFDYIVQKAVELGVHQIIPWVADHSVVRYDSKKQEQKKDRWQKIAAEAAKQCRRTVVPTVTSVKTLAEVFRLAAPESLRLFCYENEKNLGIKDVLQQSQAKEFLLLIGPEGGFSASEAELIQGSGATAITLGPRILRTETAATTALAVVMYECGDLGGPLCQK